MMLGLNYILESLLKMLVLKCFILNVEICSILWNLKEWREHNTCILPNQLYMFSHRISSYKMSRNVKECISLHSFELNPITLLTDKFQWGVWSSIKQYFNLLFMQSLIFIEVKIDGNKLMTPIFLFLSLKYWIYFGNRLEGLFYTEKSFNS